MENNVLDGVSFDETVRNDNLDVISIEQINSKKEDKNKIKIQKFQMIYLKKSII